MQIDKHVAKSTLSSIAVEVTVGAIAGICHRDAGQVDLHQLTALSEACAPLGPDAEARIVSPGVAMVHRKFEVDRSTIDVVSPYEDSQGYLVALDGRIDNLNEIAGLVRRPREAAHLLLLAGYRALGIGLFQHLIGDFSLAIWDPNHRCVVLCSDALGIRTLYYHVSVSSVVWATRARAVLTACDLSPIVDERYVAAFFANRAPVIAPFANISVIPPGHFLAAGPERLSVTRYWEPSLTREIRYREDAEYEAHLRDLLRTAVSCRIATIDPVFAELSGGLDSSSIVCIARQMEGLTTPPIIPLSYVFDETPLSNEEEHISAVERHLGVTTVKVRESLVPLLQRLGTDSEPDVPSNDLCFIDRSEYVASVMQQFGARVILSGVGGDQLFWSQPPMSVPLLDALQQDSLWRIIDLIQQCSRLAEWSCSRTVWRGIVKPAFGLKESEPGTADWFARPFASRVRELITASDRLEYWSRSSSLPSVTAHHRLIRHTMRPFGLDRHSGRAHVEVRYPLLDRRIVEFMLAIPLDQKLRIPETRSIQRRALRGVLPDSIRTRRTKAGPSAALVKALIRESKRVASLMSNPRVVAHGYVEPRRFAVALDKARHGLVGDVIGLFSTISLELWLRSLEHGVPEPKRLTAAPYRRPH